MNVLVALLDEPSRWRPFGRFTREERLRALRDYFHGLILSEQKPDLLIAISRTKRSRAMPDGIWIISGENVVAAAPAGMPDTGLSCYYLFRPGFPFGTAVPLDDEAQKVTQGVILHQHGSHVALAVTPPSFSHSSLDRWFANQQRNRSRNGSERLVRISYDATGLIPARITRPGAQAYDTWITTMIDSPERSIFTGPILDARDL